MPDWLPELEPFNEYGGDWLRYLDALYAFFQEDFVDSKPCFRGRRLGLKRHPITEGKEATFWHFISEGNKEAERTPDMRRCERIRWPASIIDNSREPELKVWAEPSGNNQRIYIWFEDEGYLVVLEDRQRYVLPWTAFYVERPHQREKYMKRWARYGAY
jgi:hypothetical protein